MRDLIIVLEKANTACKEWSLDVLAEFLEKIKLDNNDVEINWDSDAGEKWASVLRSTTRIGIVSVDLPIAFVKEELGQECKSRGLPWNVEVVVVEDFDKREWFVDLSKLGTAMPNMNWHASTDAVDPKCFSIEELWYATI